jgi:hypothetical protein
VKWSTGCAAYASIRARSACSCYFNAMLEQAASIATIPSRSAMPIVLLQRFMAHQPPFQHCRCQTCPDRKPHARPPIGVLNPRAPSEDHLRNAFSNAVPTKAPRAPYKSGCGIFKRRGAARRTWSGRAPQRPGGGERQAQRCAGRGNISGAPAAGTSAPPLEPSTGALPPNLGLTKRTPPKTGGIQVASRVSSRRP